MPTCKFCGKELKPGTGIMYVKKDGTIFYFCSKKCYRNFEMRNPREVKWTKAYREAKQLRMRTASKHTQ
ncbi:MAG: 50S ribosomal protein L24 [Candidatus Nanohaloarchaeota archaeon]|nr:50S ribosomal protein L24 [Candidatus Nanohaloarchaeota archaeon]